MMRSLKHRFVQYMPETLEPGILYISLEYLTASHLCCCGCGEEVVTPFSPVSWKMTFDGEAVSLWPSIGNWNLRCRSHYIIDRGRVVVAGSWTDEQVAAERQRDKQAKSDYFGTSPVAPPESQGPVVQLPAPRQTGWFGKVWRRLFG
jgi:hypothetical protein